MIRHRYTARERNREPWKSEIYNREQECKGFEDGQTGKDYSPPLEEIPKRAYDFGYKTGKETKP